MNTVSKMVLLGGLAIAATFTMAAPVAAYEGPWCLQVNNGRSVGERCHFTTFDGCAQERLLSGTTSFCHPNPYWVAAHGYGAEAAMAPVHRKKRHRH